MIKRLVLSLCWHTTEKKLLGLVHVPNSHCTRQYFAAVVCTLTTTTCKWTHGRTDGHEDGGTSRRRLLKFSVWHQLL